MHFAFIPYGKRSEVELLLRNMEAQKHLLKMWKDGQEKKIWIEGQVRILPLGVCEYVFPREDVDCVLNTLVDYNDRYGVLTKMIYGFLKKFYKLKEIPEYKKDNQYLWIKENVNIIPLGIREDCDILDDLNGFTHEAI